ncbi:WD40 repeat-containing protein [Tieghemostelium lacteum]|uniref:WD40 repeat-containing protein n=1 Tax=Tieghemostelium lacteum TaxID=361077 RepID=A0A151Z3W9_TIELA|nr:WD40 repeat-containing protein [Tieghemostelium lacteum]|eukprot:KYQ88663.1 WD40 repeat-containing protein [Tieghemostelium lacteum]
MDTHLFTPFKSVGYITSPVPYALKRQGLENLFMIATGNEYNVVESGKLRVVRTSEKQNGKIRSVAWFGRLNLTSCKNDILLWNTSFLQYTFKGHSSKVTKIYVFDNILLSLSMNNEFFIWDLKAKKILPNQLPPFSNSQKVTQFIHPKGYYNKIIVAFENGQIQLWNVKTRQLIYTFKGWGSEVTYLEQSPVQDIVAIGLADGRVILHHLRFDMTLCSYTQEGMVTSISFRTDGTHHMASSNNNGHISVWNLDNKTLFHEWRPHRSSIANIEYLPEEPILVSNGNDNALRVWSFTKYDGYPYILRELSGHSEPPTQCQFYGNSNPDSIITISKHSIRSISTKAASHSKEFSHKKEHLKILQQISVNDRRHQAWDTVVSSHKNAKSAYSWDANHATINSKHKYNCKSNINCLTLSNCGNFVFLGQENGCISKFNVQSGIKRADTKFDESSRIGSISALVADPINRFLVSGSTRGQLNFWNFETLSLEHTIKLGSPVTLMELHKDSGMVAVVTDENIIRLYDVDNRNLVREFSIDSNSRINALTFNHDGRWILASSTNLVIRVFDIPSSRMLDWFRVSKPVTSMSFSPLGDFLATTHSNEYPVYIWCNQTYFSSVFLKEPSAQPELLQFPSLQIDSLGHGEDEQYNLKLEDDDREMDDIEFKDISVEEFNKIVNPNEQSHTQIGHLVTLSNLPKSKWQTLLNLDTIKERNKPTIIKEKPELAPFFLTTIQGLEPKFALPSDLLSQKSTTVSNDIQDEVEDPDNIPNPEGWEDWSTPSNTIQQVDEDNVEMQVDEQLEGSKQNGTNGKHHDSDSDNEMEDDEEVEEFINLNNPKIAQSKQEKILAKKGPKEVYTSNRVINVTASKSTRTKFNLELENGFDRKDYRHTLEILKSLSPSEIDFEIRMLTSNDNFADIHFMFNFLLRCLAQRNDYDFVQSLLTHTLKVHGHHLFTPQFAEELQSLQNVTKKSWSQIQDIFQSDICLLRYFTNTLSTN